MKKRKKVFYFFLLLFLFFVILIFGRGGKTLKINNADNFTLSEDASWEDRKISASAEPMARSPLTGLPCANANQRPLAVMLSGDAVARPLAGLSQADLVINMPVITNSITRFMAVFICEHPKEIGSIRSARDDFLPLAQGLDAIYAHWGGSHFALDKLNAGLMDNLDALKNPFNAFYRKAGIEAPHNGFSSFDRLWEAARKMNYRLTGKVNGYPHLDGDLSPVATTTKTLTIGFPGSFQVKYEYHPQDNSYWRWRGGKKEIDKNTGQQVAAKNVLIMRTTSRQIEGQYNDVQVSGQGQALIFLNGEKILGIWKKDASNPKSKLYFYDQNGQEVKLVPGQIWLEIVQDNQTITWE